MFVRRILLVELVVVACVALALVFVSSQERHTPTPADRVAQQQPLVRAADEHADLAAFLADVERRAADEEAGVGGGVNLLTYHRAKGLEFDAVLLPALEEGLLPIRQASTPQEVAEERRLLYVGLTRARTHLWLSWAARRRGRARRGPARP